MEVILRQDVKNLGFADDVVKVKNGYANNYLIPRGFAVLADASRHKMHAENMKQRAHKVSQMKDEADKAASSLGDVMLTIPAKVGENGKLFGSVTSQQIADMLNKMGFKIEKKQISMPDEHIKNTGTYQAEVSLHRETKVKVNFEVVAE